MRVTNLELANFRNYGSQAISPGPSWNVFVGENAQGKSNLLEALYVLATTKSARAKRDSELVRFGSTTCSIKANVQRSANIDLAIEIEFSTIDKKSARVNGVRHTRMSEVIGQLNAVLFDSSDLELIRGEPSVRRRFLDLEIAQTSPRYAHALGAYRKSLEQRNGLLKAIRDRRAEGEALSSLSIWDAQLTKHGGVLIERRQVFLERLGILGAKYLSELSGGRDELSIMYEPSFPVGTSREPESIVMEFNRQLSCVRADESVRGTTLLGPHRDDVVFKINGSDSRLFASQGQQRTITLAVKLAERQLIEELVGEPPLFLLDDVLSDLDDLRRGRLFAAVAVSGSQTFLTCTNLRSFPDAVLSDARIWHVAAGLAQAEPGPSAR